MNKYERNPVVVRLGKHHKHKIGEALHGNTGLGSPLHPLEPTLTFSVTRLLAPPLGNYQFTLLHYGADVQRNQDNIL